MGWGKNELCGTVVKAYKQNIEPLLSISGLKLAFTCETCRLKIAASIQSETYQNQELLYQVSETKCGFSRLSDVDIHSNQLLRFFLTYNLKGLLAYWTNHLFRLKI